MNANEYINNPCQASSLPFWKTNCITIPEHILIFRDDEFSVAQYEGMDESYFKLIHDLKTIKTPSLPNRFDIVQCSIADFAHHINECYAEEGVSPEQLHAYQSHPVYDPDLWIAVAEKESKRIVATGIAELDKHIGEGILEWIQVSPDYRHTGLGSFIVNELLLRMQSWAKFVTVSGRMNNPNNPLALYKSCGFTHLVVWHIVTT